MIANLADWAEDDFQRLCSDVGVSRNKSMQDRTGWDYVVEWPVSVLEYQPHDRRPPGLMAKVQVKSLENGPPRAELNLKNALRYATEDIAYFIVVSVATGSAHPVHRYAVHIWGAQIAQILKRARKADADGRDDLHKIDITIPLSDADLHDDDLLPWMERTIRAFGASYITEKRMLNATLGYEQGQYEGEFWFPVGATEEFIDHTLGLTPTFKLDRVLVSDRRFGIKARQPTLDGTDLVGRILATPDDCALLLIDNEKKSRLVDGQIFRAPIVGLPANLQKLRVSGGFFDLVIALDRTIQFHIDGDPHILRNLEQLEQICFFMAAIDRATVEIEVRTGSLPALQLTLPRRRNRYARSLGQPGAGLRILERIGTPRERHAVAISLEQIEAHWHDLLTFCTFIESGRMKSTVAFHDGWAFKGRTRRLLLHGHLHLGDWTFHAVVERRLEREMVRGAAVGFTYGRPVILASSIRPRAAFIAEGEGKPEFDRWLDRDRDGTIVMHGGCYNDVVKAHRLGKRPAGEVYLALEDADDDDRAAASGHASIG